MGVVTFALLLTNVRKRHHPHPTPSGHPPRKGEGGREPIRSTP